MKKNKQIPLFGVVDPEGEHGLLGVGSGSGALCRLTLVARTERGYPRRELAVLPLATWKQIAVRARNELVRGMDAEEIGGAEPKFRAGEQAVSPLIARELAVLFWALMEDGEGTLMDALFSGWQQLAREERWWLYARASNPAQRLGAGWRRALYYALTDPGDTRTAPKASPPKEILETELRVSNSDKPDPQKEEGKRSSRKAPTKKKAKKAKRAQVSPPRKTLPTKKKTPLSTRPSRKSSPSSSPNLVQLGLFAD